MYMKNFISKNVYSNVRNISYYAIGWILMIVNYLHHKQIMEGNG